MANRVRGESTIKIGDRSYTVALGLRALAELEDEFGAENFEEVLSTVFGAKTSARSMIKFVVAVLRANGVDVEDQATRQAIDRMSALDFAVTAKRMLEGSGLMDQADSDDSGGTAERPLAVPSGGDSGSKSD